MTALSSIIVLASAMNFIQKRVNFANTTVIIIVISTSLLLLMHAHRMRLLVQISQLIFQITIPRWRNMPHAHVMRLVWQRRRCTYKGCWEDILTYS